MNPGFSGSKDTLLVLDQQIGLPHAITMTLSRALRWEWLVKFLLPKDLRSTEL